jgi:SUN domain-containing protein 1/2
VLKREQVDFKESLTKYKSEVQAWATDAVAPDIRRLDARDRELVKERAATADAPSTAPTPNAPSPAPTGLSEARIAELIDAALEQYSADRLALPDFALESAGASIVRWRTSPTYRSHAWLPLPRPLGPSTALQPDNTVGRCFAFPGAQGNFTVRLPVPVQVSAITIDHVSARIAHSVESAPRDFAVWVRVSSAYLIFGLIVL